MFLVLIIIIIIIHMMSLFNSGEQKQLGKYHQETPAHPPGGAARCTCTNMPVQPTPKSANIISANTVSAALKLILAMLIFVFLY